MKKWLVLVPVLALLPFVVPTDHPLTHFQPVSVTSPSGSDGIDLPVLGNLGGAGSVPTPAAPKTPNPKVAKPPTPATPATPALPPGTTLTTPNPNDDPCDGFDNTDARERCREDQEQFNERDFERTHNTPEPLR
jgi:hypothetical protein